MSDDLAARFGIVLAGPEPPKMGRQRHRRSQRSGPGNRFQAGRQPTWAGTGHSRFSVGRRAKDAEPVSLGGSMSAKVLYL